jgi:DNA-binding IclR family transcriptional regulator
MEHDQDQLQKVDGSVRSIGRAIDVLCLFDAHHPVRELRDIVESTGLPKTTAVRILATLEARGLVLARPDGTYGLGASFLRWVRLSQSIWDVNAATRQLMRELVEQCGETVNIYVRLDTHRVSIAQEEGTATVRSVIEVGVAMPMTAGATAKILLGGAPASVIDELARTGGPLDRSSFKKDIEAAAHQGYAITHGERELGASAVAAPIFNQDGRVIAAVSVSGPTPRFTEERVTTYVQHVTRTAEKISAAGLGSVEAFL